MTEVFIVSKTRMRSGVCVSGLTSFNQSVRLIPQGRRNQADNAPYEIGQIWDIEYVPSSNKEPPHVEDVEVRNPRYVGCIKNLSEFLLGRVQPWKGGPENLFDGLITIASSKAYVPRSGPIPRCSTGYWFPSKPLFLHMQDGKPYYRIALREKAYGEPYPPAIFIKFVGFQVPIPKILPGTLIRVSLARWLPVETSGEERCYLQVSGWYDR